MTIDIPIIETRRLRLREFRQSDLPAFAAMNANPEFIRFLGSGVPISKEESWRVMSMLLGHWQLRGFGMWLIEHKETGQFLGRGGLWQPEGWPGIEAGWGLSPEAWGQGYATEAARAFIDWGFEQLECYEIISIIHPENSASKKVAERIGENFKGRQQVNGKDAEIYAITRQAYIQSLK